MVPFWGNFEHFIFYTSLRLSKYMRCCMLHTNTLSYFPSYHPFSVSSFREGNLETTLSINFKVVAFSWLCTFECGRWLSKWEMVICNCKDRRPLCPVTPPLLIPTRRPIGESRIFQMISPVEKFYWPGNQEVADSLHCQTIRRRNFSSDPPSHQGHQQFSPE